MKNINNKIKVQNNPKPEVKYLKFLQGIQKIKNVLDHKEKMEILGKVA